ncbi:MULTISPECIES: DUF2793 domain-containing protein [Pseudovibrio]|uniref:DUF2793 domain-containing protein n=1 Tax=Stappiaceae TaxID=2821832 RepID=UPI0023664597|nr:MULTISPECIES: DUF2793 domain-containing protein [Pseudovibrio]MDD7908466.1 DUF2793 domain-containing protein [Pseudovibrio exalbescens]MDX5592666.1 DUF2793 domain-containing protein [Pseudovibrio sp. SPO723]
MSSSARLGLPFIASSQAQKHVTHNEALFRLDQLVSCAVERRDLSAPPSALEGQGFIVSANPVDAWAGREGQLAFFVDGAWSLLAPVEGQLVYIAAEEALAVYGREGWTIISAPAGLGGILSVGGGGGTNLGVGGDGPAERLQVFGNSIVATAPAGAHSGFHVVEELLSDLSGSVVETSIQFPDRAIVLCVSTRTVTAVSGASSYDCGISGETSKFGGSLGAAEGATNAGVIGPQAVYSPTRVRLTANGGSFTGGAVRVALHYFLPQVPLA